MSVLNGLPSPRTTGPAPANTSKTYAGQAALPKLPVPNLEDTMKKYLRALEGLQGSDEHSATEAAVQTFLQDPEQGPRLQQKLTEYNEGKDSYIEEFWYESYLGQTESVVLSLNPFFVLEDDPTPSRGSQLPRAASLILSSLGFIHDLRAGVLEPDKVRGVGLDMDQYSRLFGTSRIPTTNGCKMVVNEEARHIVVIRRGQFYWFDALDTKNRPTMTEREILSNLQAIIKDADVTPINEVAKGAIGVLSTENRKVWSSLRSRLTSEKHNASCLRVVDTALFVVCLDDTKPEGVKEVCGNFLCGTYKMEKGVQVGTCTNRWYDKLQIIVTANGEAGINFEHTGVDGHTVLRFAADVYTELVLLFAKSINPSAPTLFKARLSPHARSFKRKPNESLDEPEEQIDTVPKKLTWNLTPEIRTGIRFAETRLSDLICQNDIEALEFKGYGKDFITKHGFSPDAYIQMAFQAAYYSLYGRIESTYEPAMTKAFLHGRTEAIRTVQPASVEWVKAWCSDTKEESKIKALRAACKSHTELTRECSKGLGQDRHLYALYCLLQRELRGVSSDSNRSSSFSSSSDDAPPSPVSQYGGFKPQLPPLFSDPGWSLLNTSILSTSNCGNPALRLFGFGPVAPDGFGIGYIIKDDGISIVAASKHLQTRRFLKTLKAIFFELQTTLKTLYNLANKPMNGNVSTHSTVLHDGDPLAEELGEEEQLQDAEDSLAGYGYFSLEDGEARNRRERRRRVGVNLVIAD